MLAPSFRPQYQNRGHKSAPLNLPSPSHISTLNPIRDSTMSSSSWLAEPGLGEGSNNQKVKSLGVLCTKFVVLYNRKDVESVELDDAAKRLGVEKRRIYDIVNVLTSIGGLKRSKKNQFSWIGFSGIAKTLGDIKESLRIGDDSVDQNEEFGEEKRNQTLAASCTNSPLKNRPALDHRKVTSLGLLTQKFVKLFLNTKADTMSLDDAAIELLGNDRDLSSKTNNNAAKVRRLSDIANVLSSLNLIEKTRQADTRKLTFRWLGLKEEPDKGVSVAIPQEGRETVAIPPTGTQRNKRTFGTGLTNMDFKRTKSSTPEDRKTISENAEVTKSDENAEANAEGKIHDWEMLAPSFRPKYQNRVLLDLFSHYKEAWNSWHVEAIHGSNRMKQPWFCSTLATLDSGHGGLMSFVSLCAHSTPLLNIYLAQVDNTLPKWIVMLRNTFSLSLLSLSN